MATARRSSQIPTWRAGVATALRRLARIVAPSATSAGQPVGQPSTSLRVDSPPSLAAPPDTPLLAGQPPRPLAGELVDPLERARAALRDARQHMTALMDGDTPAQATVAEAEAPFALDPEELRELLHELREERRVLIDEITGLRSLVYGLREDVRQLREALAPARLPEPSPVAELPSAVAEPQRADTAGGGGALPPAGRRTGSDFGWWARPDAVAGGLAPEPAAAAAAVVPADAALEPEQAATSGQLGDAEEREIQLPAAGVRLAIGPVRSIGRLTALERRLVREPALSQVTLADYRRQIASFIITPRAALALAALEPAICGEEGGAIEASWQADGTLRVALAPRREGGA
ncbi:MAG TPA: hypothetical protein VH916_12120 [Dehalococcoidia bacterium]